MLNVKMEAMLRVIEYLYLNLDNEVRDQWWVDDLDVANALISNMLPEFDSDDEIEEDPHYQEALVLLNNAEALCTLYKHNGDLLKLKSLENEIGFNKKLSSKIESEIDKSRHDKTLAADAIGYHESIDKEIARIERMLKAGGEE